MSEIDSYQHECIGIVDCPTSYKVVYGSNPPPGIPTPIPLYRIDEDTTAGDSFQAKRGDLLLGGGRGESPAFRISIPEAIHFFTEDDYFDAHPELDALFSTNQALRDWHFRAYWTLTQAFVFGEGYAKLGWTPDEPIETWLTEHILAFVLREYPAVYGAVQGSAPLERAGSICRLPTPEERRIW
jgi:hypothetical protein